MVRATPDPAFPSAIVRATPTEGHLDQAPLSNTKPACLTDLRWSRVSNLESSSHEAGTLPPGHHCSSHSGSNFLLRCGFEYWLTVQISSSFLGSK
ncbi:hypothetical protein AVEN_188804-1 [Araneus ventricosus]|uniref:Uncharacterized protein n=1 Tax=Araneus ventricosus TaxID=182803 RepID=A0A4Y2BVB0_ARAVE|nr:hypothetical protein AVEN_188804-1 [Araneus ventricosus]